MARALFRSEERAFAEAIDALCYVNPFAAERQALERRALGARFRDVPDAWALGPGHTNANLLPLRERAGQLIERVRQRLDAAQEDEFCLYASVVRFVLYYEFLDTFETLCEKSTEARFSRRRVSAFQQFRQRAERLLGANQAVVERLGSLHHLFACQFQLYRAFQHIFGTIVGASRPAQKLREAVWESVFTRDMRRYERGLYRQMHRINTLILGPSGTGKELVARAIGRSRYLPFDERSLHFEEEVADAFFALNISALSPTLIESELFGHKRGSFTGAVADRVGWLEACPDHGTVFLDEIGDLDLTLQVKLLRTLQSREFQRVGEQVVRQFGGKIISATNRDLGQELQSGRMREDFYYRLCSDVVATPSLASQLRDRPEDLQLLVEHVAKRHFADQDAIEIAELVLRWVEQQLGIEYGWPGNVRELEQCVFNVAVRGEYHPLARAPAPPSGLRAELGRSFLDATLGAERLLDVYCTLVFAQTGSFSETGRQLGLDRRTVRTRVDKDLLARLNDE